MRGKKCEEGKFGKKFRKNGKYLGKQGKRKLWAEQREFGKERKGKKIIKERRE